MSRPTPLVLGITLATVFFASVAHADRVLLFQRKTMDAQGADEAAALAAADFATLGGHDVTVISAQNAVLPDDLSVYDTIWLLQIATTSLADKNRLHDFVIAGGGLLITAETPGTPCCDALNNDVEYLMNNTSMLRMGITVGVLNVGDNFQFVSTAPGDLDSTPNVLADWPTIYSGSCVVPDANVVARKPEGIGAAAWRPEELTNAAGCVVLLMDITTWLPQTTFPNRVDFVENLEHFLMNCGDSDHDGVSDEAELRVGLDPSNPDTDGDGVCDGWGKEEACPDGGEFPPNASVPFDEDSDGDGLINALDPDDDNDGLPTAVEVEYGAGYPTQYLPWLIADADLDGVVDRVEGVDDADGDGIPGFVDPDEQPPWCDTGTDAECGGAESGKICLDEHCAEGCRATGGNGCPDGETCTSTNEEAGFCVGPPGSDAGPGGDGGAGGGSGGCSCRAAPRDGGGALIVVTLALGFFFRRRSRSVRNANARPAKRS